MCKNNKFILFKECILKYWGIVGNLILYQTLNQGQSYPAWIYITAFLAIITSFARLMLKFRRQNIPSISCIMYPMLPCEKCLCDTREDGTYQPVPRRILCGGFLLFFLWIWYALIIYPFITFFVIICIFYYHIEDDEFSELLLLYKNHNLIAIFIEDIPIFIIVIAINVIDNKGIVALVWYCIMMFIKLFTLSLRIFIDNKFLYTIEEINENTYRLANTHSNSSESPPPHMQTSIDLETQLQQDGL